MTRRKIERKRGATMAPTSNSPAPTLRALGPDLWEAELNLQEGMHLRFFYRAFGMWRRFGPNRL
ncbi:MAG TPA: hypothetical protein VFG23_22830 [Polyangia bacterium]|nr:hypothetical protein [Polyangia bacterium]